MTKALIFMLLLFVASGCYSTGYQPQYIISQEIEEKVDQLEL